MLEFVEPQDVPEAAQAIAKRIPEEMLTSPASVLGACMSGLLLALAITKEMAQIVSDCTNDMEGFSDVLPQAEETTDAA